MSVVKKLVLFKQMGENSTSSRDPLCAWTGQVSLDEQTNCCLTSDDDRLVSVDKYEVREVELPDWLSPAEWAGTAVKWKYAWGAGVDMSWPESWQRWLRTLDFEAATEVSKLLRVKNFRSTFRKSLRDQIVEWAETPESERKFGSPLSHRQWACLQPRGGVRQRTVGLYYDRSWPGRVLTKEEAMAAVSESAAA